MGLEEARARLRQLSRDAEILQLRERIAEEAEFDVERGRERLRALLRTAVHRVPYYRRTAPGGPVTLRDFPFVTKADLARDMGSFLSRGTNGRIGADEFLISQTSGSTGEPVSVITTRRTGRLANWISEERYNRLRDAPVEGTTLSLSLHCGGTPIYQAAPLPRPHLRVNLPGFDPESPTISELYRTIVGRFGVDRIVGTSSRVLALAEYTLRHGIRLRPAVVQASYEAMPESARDVIREAFDCPVSMVYMTAETGHAAWECSEGNLHFQDDLVLPELRARTPGDGSEIVLTALFSTVMPVIRYVTGDLGSGFGSCPCPLPGTVMGGLLGRAASALVGRDGTVYAPWSLLTALSDSGLASFQVLQETAGVVRIICPGQTDLAEDVVAALNIRMNDRTRPEERFELRAAPQEQFVITALGKRNILVQRLEVATTITRTRYLY